MTALAPTLQSFFTERLDRPAASEPEHDRRLPRHDAAAARVRRQTASPPARRPRHRRPRRPADRRLPHPPRKRARQQRHAPATPGWQRSTPSTATRRSATPNTARHPARARDPTQTHRTRARHLPRPTEIDALLPAPDRSTWAGRRDHALLLTAIQTGLRASELTGLNRDDVHLATGAHVSCLGKGRKQRITPLTAVTVAVLRVWLDERGGQPDSPLFPTQHGRRLSRDALERRLAKHLTTAATRCPTLHDKNVTPHTLRHTAAMQLLHAGVDTTVIALWLGHERVDTTQIYLHADLALKERALARTKPPNAKPGRYRPPDKLLAFLEAL